MNIHILKSSKQKEKQEVSLSEIEKSTKEKLKVFDKKIYQTSELVTNNEKDNSQEEKMKKDNSVKIVETPEEYRLWLEATTDMTAKQIKISVDAYEKEYFSKRNDEQTQTIEKEQRPNQSIDHKIVI